MTNPQTSKFKYGTWIEEDGKSHDMEVEGTIDIVWDYKHSTVTDVVAYEITVTIGKEVMAFQGGFHTKFINETVETVLGVSIENIAEAHCECKPPTDGSVQDEADYQENIDDFYPPMPRG